MPQLQSKERVGSRGFESVDELRSVIQPLYGPCSFVCNAIELRIGSVKTYLTTCHIV